MAKGDKLKGRIKEAAGDLIDDPEIARKGRRCSSRRLRHARTWPAPRTPPTRRPTRSPTSNGGPSATGGQAGAAGRRGPARVLSPARSKRSERPSRAANASSWAQWRRRLQGSARRPSIVASTSHSRSPSARPAYQPVGAERTCTEQAGAAPDLGGKGGEHERVGGALMERGVQPGRRRSCGRRRSRARCRGRWRARSRRPVAGRRGRGRRAGGRARRGGRRQQRRRPHGTREARASSRSASGGQPPRARRVKPSISDQRYQDLFGDPKMPSLQLDVPVTYDLETKRALARRLGATYADVMQFRPDLVTVAIRDLGEGGVWRCSQDEPHPSALLMCDIRRGRPVESARRAEPAADRGLRGGRRTGARTGSSLSSPSTRATRCTTRSTAGSTATRTPAKRPSRRGLKGLSLYVRRGRVAIFGSVAGKIKGLSLYVRRAGGDLR